MYIYIYIHSCCRKGCQVQIYINIGHVIRREVRIPVEMFHNKA